MKEYKKEVCPIHGEKLRMIYWHQHQKKPRTIKQINIFKIKKCVKCLIDHENECKVNQVFVEPGIPSDYLKKLIGSG